MRNETNRDLKRMLKGNDISYWQIAEVIGVHENTIIRWMRTELPDKQKFKITQAAYKIINEREEV